MDDPKVLSCVHTVVNVVPRHPLFCKGSVGVAHTVEHEVERTIGCESQKYVLEVKEKGKMGKDDAQQKDRFVFPEDDSFIVRISHVFRR